METHPPSRQDDGDLALGIATAVGEKPVVVTSGAVRTGREVLHPAVPGLLRQQRAEVDMPSPGRRPSRQLFKDLRPDLIAPTADRGAEVHA